MSDWPLEPPRARLQSWLDALAQLSLDHVDALPTASARGNVGAAGLAIAGEVSRPITEAGLAGGMEEVVSLLERAVEGSLVTAGPGYLAYVPGGGLPSAGFADLWSNLTNRFTGLSAAAPALCRLESDVLRWLAAQFGYDDQARGLLTSGGSLANFSGIVTARVDKLGDDVDLRTAVAYTSSQVHHSVKKSTRLAGLPPKNLRSIPVDDRFAMDAAALDAAIASDRAAGLRPFLVVSSAGTTNTGAVDPLGAISDICEREGLWHHADGAYGGAFALCEAGKQALSGLERADSITFDPHKGMFLPYGLGCLLVRNGAALRAAHAGEAGYLQDFAALERDGEPPSPTDYGPELSRDFRGLRLWLPLMLHGAAPFREALAEKIELAKWFAGALDAAIAAGCPVEMVARPMLSTVAFRLRRSPGEALAEWNARNAAFLARINDRERVYLSSTQLPVDDGDAFTLRVCIVSFRTHQAHIEACLEDLVAAAACAS